jgi:hypothetical protein
MKHNKTIALAGFAIAMLTTVVKGGNPELPLDLGSAGNFVILGKTGISNVPYSDVTGDMGVSPVAASAITGFSLILDSSTTFSTSAQVTGKIYASDYGGMTPGMMTTAISDMETAYTQAALRTLPDETELMAGDISGLTLTPGLYKWSTGVLINTDVWLDAAGNPDAVFIFQIAGDLTMESYQEVILMGGAQAKNIFWQVAGGAGAVIKTYAHFEGVILAAKKIDLQTGASFNGKLLAQTAVNLDGNAIMDSSLITNSTLVTLEILSEHGTGNPTTGLYSNVSGSLLTNSISATETLLGGTQYVNIGWNMTSNSPLFGITNSMEMIHTNNAVLTWLWSTNYFLTMTAVNGVITNAVEGWKTAQSSQTLYPEADFGYAFDHWVVNGIPFGSGVPLSLTMDEAKNVVAVFSTLFVDVSSNVNWNVTWVFDPRKGYFLGTLTITHTNGLKRLLAPFWFEVASTEWHWLRTPTGLDAQTDMHYLDISSDINSQLPGIGNGDLALDPGESVTVTGIELMGRRTPDGLVMAVWADPPGQFAARVDTDGDGMPDADEYIAGTLATNPDSVFRIRLSADHQSVLWDGQPNRIYTVLTSTNLSQGFVIETDNIPSTGGPMIHNVVPRALDGDLPGMRFYRVNVNVK